MKLRDANDRFSDDASVNRRQNPSGTLSNLLLRR